MFSFPKPIRLYQRILVDEFMRAVRAIREAHARNESPRADFGDTVLDYLTTLIKAVSHPIPGGGAASAVVSGGFSVANRQRKQSSEDHLVLEVLTQDEAKFRIIIEAVALEAASRYQYVLLTQLIEDEPLKGVVPFALVGVKRMLEYISRKRLPISIKNLLDGLHEGRSGAKIGSYKNTQLTPRHKPYTFVQQAKALFKLTEYTAEGIYGRSGWMTPDRRYFVISNPRKAKCRVVSNGGFEPSLLNYGYTHFKEKTFDPKYGYTYVSKRTLDKFVGHLKKPYPEPYRDVEHKLESLSPSLQQDLTSFKPSIVVINHRDLVTFVAFAQARDDEWKNDDYPEKSLLKFIQRRDKNSDACFIIYAPESERDRDLSTLDFSGLCLDQCSFIRCAFGGSLAGTTFKDSYLIGSNWSRVKTAEGADMSRAHAEYLQAPEINLTNSILNQTNLSFADLTKATLASAQTMDVNWHKTITDGVITAPRQNLRAQEAAPEEKIDMADALRLRRANSLRATKEELERLEREKPSKDENAPLNRLIRAVQGLYQEQLANYAFEYSTSLALARLERTHLAPGNDLQAQNTQIEELRSELIKLETHRKQTEASHAEILQEHTRNIANLQVRMRRVEENVDPPYYHNLNADMTVKWSADIKRNLVAQFLEVKEITDVFGKRLQLDGQYINLAMVAQSPSNANKAVAQAELKEEKEEKGKPSQQDARISSYEDLLGTKHPIKPEELFKADNVLHGPQKNQPQSSPNLLVLQGRAGIGKTTFLHYVTREWASERLFSQFQWVFKISLRDLRRPEFAADRGQLTLWKLIHQTVAASVTEKQFEFVWKEIKEALLKGKGLIILDGWDELPDRHCYEEALKILLNNKMPKLITSRPHSVASLPSNRRDVEIIGFVDANIEQYLRAYFPEQPAAIPKLVTGLRQQPGLWASIHVPIIMNLVCVDLIDAVKKNPENLQKALEGLQTMTDLYSRMVYKLYEREFLKNNKPVAYDMPQQTYEDFLLTHYKQVHQFLAELAYMGMQGQQLIFTEEEVKKLSVKYQIKIPDACALGILRPIYDSSEVIAKGQSYEFLHLTFQEYYAAVHFINEFTHSDLSKRKPMEDFLVVNKYNPSWQIVWWFVAGLLKNTPGQLNRYIAILNGCITNDSILSRPLTGDLFQHSRLGLLVRCIDEGYSKEEDVPFNAQIRQEIQNILHELYITYERYNHLYYTIDFQSPLFQALRLSPRLCQADGVNDLYAHLDIEAMKLIINFAQKVGVATPKVFSLIIKKCSDPDYRPESTEIVGLFEGHIISALYIKQLTERMIISIQNATIPFSEAFLLSKIGPNVESSVSHVYAFLSNNDPAVRLAAIKTLIVFKGQINESRFGKAIESVLLDACNLKAAKQLAFILSMLNKPVLPFLPAFISHTLKLGLKLIDEPDTLDNLHDIFNYIFTDLPVMPYLLQQLRDMLNHDNKSIRRAAIYIIAGIGDKALTLEITEILFILIRDPVLMYAISKTSKQFWDHLMIRDPTITDYFINRVIDCPELSGEVSILVAIGTNAPTAPYFERLQVLSRHASVKVQRYSFRIIELIRNKNGRNIEVMLILPHLHNWWQDVDRTLEIYDASEYRSNSINNPLEIISKFDMSKVTPALINEIIYFLRCKNFRINNDVKQVIESNPHLLEQQAILDCIWEVFLVNPDLFELGIYVIGKVKVLPPAIKKRLVEILSNQADSLRTSTINNTAQHSLRLLEEAGIDHQFVSKLCHAIINDNYSQLNFDAFDVLIKLYLTQNYPIILENLGAYFSKPSESLTVEEFRIRFLIKIAREVFICVATKNISPFTVILDPIALAYLFFGASFNYDISCQIYWDNERQQYFAQGFVNKDAYKFPLDMTQAQALRHLVPWVIGGQIEDEDTGYRINRIALLTRLEQLPPLEQDPILSDSRANNLCKIKPFNLLDHYFLSTSLNSTVAEYKAGSSSQTISCAAAPQSKKQSNSATTSAKLSRNPAALLTGSAMPPIRESAANPNKKQEKSGTKGCVIC